ncbi:UDP-N-acetylglucosamine--peptide N-acetylglucosaminyltransferase subunit [Trichinella spiralis]|uniref:UDP-N-acetylglucosamine--peptide N-acetylglucosaminyltransferase subunit n=1 Tax=Trichinella spiralis TaxID=6334 RepID=UPI0001EFC48F|nr:UDP-N-acetylglucosamine--peptide N-acetylglucosaminyltransferase subunit [Trichinella spiralis]
MLHLLRYLPTDDEDCSSSLSCSRVISSVRAALRTLHDMRSHQCRRQLLKHPSGVFLHFHPVRMHESRYNVNIQCCSVQDVHEQPEWPSASYPAACILLNHIVDNVYSVFAIKKSDVKQSNAAEIFAKNSGELQNVPHLTCGGIITSPFRVVLFN